MSTSITTSPLSFLTLPFEIRSEIYRHLLPTTADLVLDSGFRTVSGDDGSHSLIPCKVIVLRHDGEECHPAILRTNRQIYGEAVRMMYNRTFTITISVWGIDFLGMRDEFCFLGLPLSKREKRDLGGEVVQLVTLCPSRAQEYYL